MEYYHLESATTVNSSRSHTQSNHQFIQHEEEDIS